MSNYVGCCGSCTYCDLSDNYTSLYTTKFKCTKYDRYVKADEEACSNLEPDMKRSTALIDKYNK